MADETRPDPTPDSEGAATPNRDRRREPPTIEGEIARPESPFAPAAAEVDSGSAQAGEPSPSEMRPEAAPAAEVTPAAAAAEPPPPASPRPILSAAIGALVGAVVAAGGVWTLTLRHASDPDVVARLEALERNPAPASPAAALAALDKRVGALEANLAAAPNKASIDAYGQRLAALESAALSAKASADAGKDALAAAQAARDDAAKALELATANAQRPNEAPAAPPAPAPGQQPNGPDVSALEGRLAKVEADLAGALARPPVDLDPISQRLDKLEKALAAPKIETRVAPEAAPPSRDAAAGLAVVAQALRVRLAAGVPFPVEEAALERLGADPAKLAILKPLAEKGAPSAAALAADFAKAAPAVLAAATPEGSSGVVDRLLSNMGKVVKVTPVGEVAGDEPAALLSQINAALGRGDAATALAAWRRLPDAARQASKPWADEAQSTIDAAKAAGDLAEDAMAQLAAAGK